MKKYVSEHKEEVTTLLKQYRILWKDELPDIQVSMPRSKEVKRSINSVRSLYIRYTADALQLSVPTKLIQVYRSILMKMDKHKQYEICNYSLRYDPKKSTTFKNLTAYHDDFMKNHEIVNFHGIERTEMENMR